MAVLNKLWMLMQSNYCFHRVDWYSGKSWLSKTRCLFAFFPIRVGPQEVKEYHPAEYGNGNGSRNAEDGETAEPGVHGRQHQQLQLRGEVSGVLLRGTSGYELFRISYCVTYSHNRKFHHLFLAWHSISTCGHIPSQTYQRKKVLSFTEQIVWNCHI